MHDRDHLLQRDGESRLGRQRIVDADDDHACARRILAHDAIVRVEAEERPAAAMQIHERGAPAAARPGRRPARVPVPPTVCATCSVVACITGPPTRQGARTSSATRRISVTGSSRPPVSRL